MKKATFLAAILAITLTLCAFTACPNGTKKLATASDVIAHALSDADQAAKQGITAGTVTQSDYDAFHVELVKVAEAGIVLDAAIRANAKAVTVSDKTQVFLDAYSSLDNLGLTHIKNDSLRLTISTTLRGAQTSVAIIAATVGK